MRHICAPSLLLKIASFWTVARCLYCKNRGGLLEKRTSLVLSSLQVQPRPYPAQCTWLGPAPRSFLRSWDFGSPANRPKNIAGTGLLCTVICLSSLPFIHLICTQLLQPLLYSMDKTGHESYNFSKFSNPRSVLILWKRGDFKLSELALSNKARLNAVVSTICMDGSLVWSCNIWYSDA